MIFRTISFMVILCLGCRTASKQVKVTAIVDDNKDVVVLSYLIRDYMQKTGSTSFTIADIIKSDTLGRITKNFSVLEIGNWPDVWRGGYAVYFKFSDRRNKDSVKLTEYEKIPWKVKMKTKIGRNEEQFAKNFDGEIHFYYPERFYHIAKIIVKEPTYQ
jgi:hypothetical protein